MKEKCIGSNVYWGGIGTIITVFILCVYAMQLTVPVISDETTTMANAAWITGRDWSWMVASLGGYYYRYAQALMTVPFFAFLKDPAAIYRLSMLLQALIQASIVPVVYCICRRHLKVESKRMATLLAMGVCLVPSMVLYTFYYRGDYLLGVFPWYVLLAFLETMKAAEEGKRGRRIVFTLISAAGSILSYMAHTRGIIVVIALVMSAVIVRILEKKISLHWPVLLAGVIILIIADSTTGKILKQALYSISGLNANAIESTDMGAYLNIFSVGFIKDLIMMCISWLVTLIFSAQGLVLIGMIAALIVLGKVLFQKKENCSYMESAVVIFSTLVFLGYYAVGALYFKGVYHSFAAKLADKRVDRLLYDRYAICGAGMLVFLALYVLCCKREWLKWKGKVVCILSALAVSGIWWKKILPIAVKYKGYIYNTIALNTFQEISDAATILSGARYGRAALIGAALLGLGLMLAILFISFQKKKWMPYALLGLVLVSDLALIHVNFVKIRKASNDYVEEATDEVVSFMQGFQDEVADEYPYILKGGLSGIKIQFYQSQLMDFKMFGKKQEEQLGQENYFIISAHDDIDETWDEGDYYLFKDYDYENAEYDIVYVKGTDLMKKMEELGYEMDAYKAGTK